MRQIKNIINAINPIEIRYTHIIVCLLQLFYSGCEKTIEPDNSFNVQGTVYIKVGAAELPISGAIISINNKVDTTDDQGHFTFSEIPAGEQTIHITHTDYAPKDTVITLTRNLNVKLPMFEVSDYILPNSMGNSWTYLIADSSGTVTDTVYSNVIGKVVGPNQELITQIRYGTRSEMWYDELLSFNNRKIYKHRDAVSLYKVKLCEENLSVGQAWNSQYQNVLFDTVRVEEILDVVGYTETYNDCYRIRHTSYIFSFEIVVDVTDYYLKPGIGFVKIYHFNDIFPFNDPQYYWMKLLSYSIIIVD
ncbi:MAG: carboxypeptidase regulatory-like domain-containing protein [Ignavibacteriales bacterium]|nr:MAG: carboxypeptidase regulatory-like domain-containing protein [Ignavibacteriales bacterium]